MTLNDFIEKKESRLRDLLGVGSLTREGQIALMELRTALRNLTDEELNRLKGQVEAEILHRASKVLGKS